MNNLTNKSIVSKNPNDPSRTGPGKWEVLNILSTKIKNKKEEKVAIEAILVILNNMNCDCAEDVTNYIKSNNIYDYRGQKDDLGRYIGVAKWVWILHNRVNLKLGKPIYSWDDFVSTHIDITNIKPCSV